MDDGMFTPLWRVRSQPGTTGLLEVHLYEVLCWRDWCGIVHKEVGQPPIVLQREMPASATELRALVEAVKARLVAACYLPYSGEVREVWWEAPKTKEVMPAV